MKPFKEFYRRRLKKKKRVKASLDRTGLPPHNFTGDNGYVNQPPVGNPPNVGYTQSFGS